MYVTNPGHTYTGTSKKIECQEKCQYFVSLISESETHILNIFITHGVKYFKPLFFETLMIMAYRWWKPKIQCLRKFEYYIRSIKKRIFKTEMSGFWKVCSFLCTQYLVGPPFAWITASMRRGMEATSLWHCSGVMEAQVALIAAFRSSALLGLVSLIFLLTIQASQVSLLVNQAQ